MYKLLRVHIPPCCYPEPLAGLFGLFSLSYLESILEQKAEAHPKTQTHAHLHTPVNEHIVPGPVSTSGTLAMIDALTWQSCQWKWQIHFAGSIRWLPTKKQKSQTVSPPYHHPPSAIWLVITLTSSTSPQGPCTSLSLAKSRQTWQPVTYLCVVFKRSYWVLLCPEYSVFLGDRGASPAFFKIFKAKGASSNYLITTFFNI